MHFQERFTATHFPLVKRVHPPSFMTSAVTVFLVTSLSSITHWSDEDECSLEVSMVTHCIFLFVIFGNSIISFHLF